MENLEFKDLPKYLLIDTGKNKLFYHPVIFKFENEGLLNAYFAMYARRYKSGNINPSQVLFCVCASSYNEAEKLFLEEYSKNTRFIKQNFWVGERPKIIDLMNMSVDKFLFVRNVKKPKK